MFHGLSKVIWNFFERQGISPWYFLILAYLFVGYFQIKVFKNWKDSTSYEKYRAIIYLIALFMVIIVIVFYLFNKQSLNLS